MNNITDVENYFFACLDFWRRKGYEDHEAFVRTLCYDCVEVWNYDKSWNDAKLEFVRRYAPEYKANSKLNFFECPVCGSTVLYSSKLRNVYYDASDNTVGLFSRDCHGIPFRLLCIDCYEKIMDEIGYDGEYYTELDECLDEYW